MMADSCLAAGGFSICKKTCVNRGTELLEGVLKYEVMHERNNCTCTCNYYTFTFKFHHEDT